MFPDIATLLLCDFLITAFMGFALLFYRSYQLTYSGFGFWVAATFVLSAGYALSFLRDILPPYFAIISSNIIFATGGLIRLDGILRFMCNRRLSRLFYASPLLLFFEFSYFYFVNDDITMRTLFLAIYLCSLISGIVYILVHYAPESARNLYHTTAFFHGLFGIVLLFRAVIWLIDPSADFFEARPIHFANFLAVTLYEVGLGLSFLMMNGQRLEEGLRNSELSLQNTVGQLRKAISEIKTLSGLVPICASCKRIRDDQGFWNQVEVYITEHTDAQFSHGICPECTQRLYPGVNLASE